MFFCLQAMTWRRMITRDVSLVLIALFWCNPSFANGDKMSVDQRLFDQVLVAAYAGDSNKLLELSKTGDINALDRQGLSAILHSVKSNRLDATQLLIDAGANVDAFDPDTAAKVIDQTAFLYAGATGNNRALKMLLSANARADIYNYYGGTALIPAAEKGHIATVRLLLEESSVDVNHVNNLGWTALMEAVLLSNGGPDHQIIVELLLSHGADPEIADKDGVTALQHAKAKGYDKIVQLLTSQKPID